MKVKMYLPKIILVIIFLFLVNLLTVSVGEDVSSVTIVNLTDYYIDVLTEGKMYSSIQPEYAIVHTTDPKPSIEVTVQYTTGQEVSGSVTRTINLPYSARDETCECDENDSPECVTYPEEGGSGKWEVLPSDFPGSGTTINKGEIWLNDQLIAENVPLTGLEYFSDFAVLGTNWSGSGTSTFFVDEIQVLSYPGSHFLDDFESYPSGSYPSANWVNRFSGSSGQISETVAHNGTKSFELVSRPTWSRVEAHVIPTSADSITYEGFLYLNQSGRGAQIGFGAVVSSNTYRTFNAMTFANDNTIRFGGADTSLTLGSWTARNWYKIKVLCRFNTMTE
jgi:hypothetical protein